MANRKATYSPGHRPGLQVPKGGSMCANCKYLGRDRKTCTEKNFIKWNGSALIPAPIDEYCSDWWEAADGALKAGKRIEDTTFEDAGL